VACLAEARVPDRSADGLSRRTILAGTAAGGKPLRIQVLRPGPAGHPCNDWGVAYSSPWWLAP
jgi:hypothetical protein